MKVAGASMWHLTPISLNHVASQIWFASINFYYSRTRTRKLKQWWSSISPITTLNTEKTTAYSNGNSGPGLGQAKKGCGVKAVNGIPTLPSYEPNMHFCYVENERFDWLLFIIKRGQFPIYLRTGLKHCKSSKWKSSAGCTDVDRFGKCWLASNTKKTHLAIYFLLGAVVSSL